MSEPNEQAKVSPELQSLSDRWNAAIRAHLQEIRGIPMTADEVIGRFIMYAGVLIQAYQYSPEILAALLNVAARANVGFQKLDGSMTRRDN